MPDQVRPYGPRERPARVGLTVEVPAPMRGELERIAKEQGRSLSDMTRRVLRAGLLALASQQHPQPETPTQ